LRQLLAPATDALSNPCLTGPITSYDWATAICLSMIFVLFFLELMTVRYASFGHSHSHDEPDLEHDGHRVDEKADSIAAPPTPTTPGTPVGPQDPDAICPQAAEGGGVCEHDEQSHALGADHLGHGRQHTAAEDDLAPTWSAPEQRLAKPKKPMTESYASQMTAIFILEFGIIFHSVFIGLTLAVAGDEFVPLYIVLCFHQTFEGLGLGTRLATAPWPASKSATPYWLALGFGLSTPTAIAVGLGIRHLYPPGSQTTLIVNGIFDSISAGILIYTGIVELMAHEFMFSPKMKAAPIKTVLAAYVQMCFGAG
jgi:zinc transporter 1/2/3